MLSWPLPVPHFSPGHSLWPEPTEITKLPPSTLRNWWLEINAYVWVHAREGKEREEWGHFSTLAVIHSCILGNRNLQRKRGPCSTQSWVCESVCVQTPQFCETPNKVLRGSVKPSWPPNRKRSNRKWCKHSVSTETLSHFRKEALGLAGVYNNGWKKILTRVTGQHDSISRSKPL